MSPFRLILTALIAVFLSSCDASWIPGYKPQEKASKSTCPGAVAVAEKRDDLSRDCQQLWDEQGKPR